MNPIWTTRAILNAVGGGRVTLDIGGAPVSLPVELPSEERLLGERLYEPVVVALLPAGEARSAEEDRAWHRAEVARLRALLVDLERSGGVTGVRVELAPRRICITAPTEAGEHAVLDAVTAWAAERGLTNPEVAAKMQALMERCQTSMRSLLDANRDALAARTFAVDTAEWGRGVAQVAPESEAGSGLAGARS